MLREVGGFGLFNKTVMIAALILATGNTAMSFFIHVYLLVAPPSQWCFVNGTSREDFPVLNLLPRRRCQLVSLSDDGFNMTVADGDTATCPTGWNFNPSEFFTSVAMENWPEENNADTLGCRFDMQPAVHFFLRLPQLHNIEVLHRSVVLPGRNNLIRPSHGVHRCGAQNVGRLFVGHFLDGIWGIITLVRIPSAELAVSRRFQHRC